MNRRVDHHALAADEWSVAEAKARFSEVVSRARAGKPQRVTRYGRSEVVVVSVDDWNRVTALADPAATFEHAPGGLLSVFEPVRGLGLDELIEGLDGDLRSAGLD